MNQILAQRRGLMELPINPRRSRPAVYRCMAALLWAQYRLENGLPYQAFEHAPDQERRDLLDHCEVVANMYLSPDLRDTAMMCGADAVVRCSYEGGQTISELASRKTQHSYLTTFEAALQAFLLNMRTEAPDPHYRDAMCRLTDVVVPKQGVM